MNRAFGCAAGLPGRFADLRRPALAPPVEALGGRLVRHALPPDAAVGRERDVREDRVARDRRPSRSGWSSSTCPARRRRTPASGLIARRRPLASGLIHAMSSPTVETFQSLDAVGRDQHREVRLAAGARKRGGDVGLLAVRIFDAEDQHVLGHPALVARDVRGDAQAETLLAEQRVAAVAGSVRPDLAGLRKMDDVFFRVAGPGHVLLAGSERRADAVHARHDALHVAVDLREDAGRPMRAMMRMLTTT